MIFDSALSNFIKCSSKAHWFNIENHPDLYFCNFRKDYYSDNLFDNYGVYFPSQIKKSVVKRRAEFLAGRYCALKALRSHGVTDIVIGIGEHRNPLWPSGFCGAISHCNDYAVAVISSAYKTLGIGIDIEELVSLDAAERLQSQILYGKELSLFGGHNKALLFTLAFSIKESFFKAAFPKVKRYFNFDAISIINIDLEGKKITLEINTDLGPHLKKGKIIFGYFHYPCGPSKLATLILL